MRKLFFCLLSLTFHLQVSAEELSAEGIALPKHIPCADGSMSNPEPPYSGAQGKVIIGLVINKSGVVERARIAVPSVTKQLDDIALNSLKNWCFSPAEKNGQPLEVGIEIPVDFTWVNEQPKPIKMAPPLH